MDLRETLSNVVERNRHFLNNSKYKLYFRNGKEKNENELFKTHVANTGQEFEDILAKNTSELTHKKLLNFSI